MRKSFIIHKDSLSILDELTDEQAGRLFKAIRAYHLDEEIELDTITKLVFSPFRNQFERDEEKYLKLVERNRNNGSKGGRPKKPKKPSGNSGNPDEPRKADSDSKSVSDSVSKSKNDSDSKSEKEYTKECIESYKRILTFFPEHLQPKNKKTQNQWLDTLDKLNRIDKIPYSTIEEIAQLGRAHEFWSKQFLSLTKLRKKNGEGIPYIVVFNEQLNNKTNGQATNGRYTPQQQAENRRIFQNLVSKYR